MPKVSLPKGSCRDTVLLQQLSLAEFVPSGAYETSFTVIKIIMCYRNECFLYIDNTHNFLYIANTFCVSQRSAGVEG